MVVVLHSTAVGEWPRDSSVVGELTWTVSCSRSLGETEDMSGRVGRPTHARSGSPVPPV